MGKRGDTSGHARTFWIPGEALVSACSTLRGRSSGSLCQSPPSINAPWSPSSGGCVRRMSRAMENPSGRPARRDHREVSLEELRDRLADFAKEREWDRFHSPRNLLLALVGEVGELSEIFQWRGEVARGLPNWSASDKEHLGEELSDVLLYLVRLADVCGLDLGRAALTKLVKNGKKYPVSTTPIPAVPLEEEANGLA